MKTCYMCEARATSKEHVPPRCLFPKDISYRKGLITVPSCDKHNSEKSKNDEYLRFVLSAVGEVNELGLNVFSGSVMRSLDYNAGLVDQFTPEIETVIENGVETATFRLRWERFQTAVDSIVRGLYFYEAGNRLTARLTGAGWAHMRVGRVEKSPFHHVIQSAERLYPSNYQGANPRVFQYEFGSSKGGKTFFCRLRFYEGHPIYVTWKSHVENSPEL